MYNSRNEKNNNDSDTEETDSEDDDDDDDDSCVTDTQTIKKPHSTKGAGVERSYIPKISESSLKETKKLFTSSKKIQDRRFFEQHIKCYDQMMVSITISMLNIIT